VAVRLYLLHVMMILTMIIQRRPFLLPILLHPMQIMVIAMQVTVIQAIQMQAMAAQRLYPLFLSRLTIRDHTATVTQVTVIKNR